MNEAELMKKLLEAFKSEAAERIESLFAQLTELEKTSDPDLQQTILEVVFREAHSLKGASRSVDLRGIESVCQEMESVFGKLKKNELDFSPGMFDIFHEAVGAIEDCIDSGDKEPEDFKEKISPLVKALIDIRDGRGAPGKKGKKETASKPPQKQVEKVNISHTSQQKQVPTAEKKTTAPAQIQKNKKKVPAPAKKPLFKDTVRIPTAKIDTLLLKAEAQISLKQISGQHLIPLKETSDSFTNWKKKCEKIMPELKRLRETLLVAKTWQMCLILWNGIRRRYCISGISSHIL